MTRTLGIANYGFYQLIMSVMAYFTIIVGYGFRFTGTDKIAKNIEQPEKLTQLFWSTIFTKLALISVCFASLCLIALVVPQVGSKFVFFLAGFMIIFGNLLLPDFYFLGVQKMKYVTLATTIGKIIFAILIFTLVKTREDVFFAILSNGIGTVIIGLIGFYFGLKHIRFELKIPSFEMIWTELKEGFYFFFSQLSVSFYSTINVILLGAFTNNTTVGYYSITEKIFKSISALVSTPINLAVFPRLSKLYTEDKQAFKLRVKQLMTFLMVVFVFLAILLFLFAQPIVNFLIKDPQEGEIEMLVKLVKIVSIALMFNPFAAFFTQQFIIKDRQKTLLKIILFLGLINIILVLIFIPNITMIIWAVVINRILAAFLNGYYSLRD